MYNTNEQPTASKVRTMPDHMEWTQNGLTHFLGGLEEKNVEAYKRVISDNDDNKVMALAQVLNIKNVLMKNVSEAWDVSDNHAIKIIGCYNRYKTEADDLMSKYYEEELRKLCEKTNHGEELAIMLMNL